jgi:prepilin peptidase CpaA
MTPFSKVDRSGAPPAVRPASLCSPITSVAIAAGVVGCLVGSGEVERLPALGGVAAFLFLVIEHDVRTLRIPNWLNFPAMLLALVYAAAIGGLAGLGDALGGIGLTFALLFPAFAMGWLGAGDVKAAMVIGALCGAARMPGLLWWMIVAGGSLALAFVVLRGGLLDLLGRWGRSVAAFCLTRQWVYLPPREGSAAAAGLPFGVAMGLGAAALQLWGAPWA